MLYTNGKYKHDNDERWKASMEETDNCGLYYDVM